MDCIPLLKVKLAIPELPNRVLYSKRIKKLNIAGHRTVIINAPAGFGKTTSVLLSLGKSNKQICWYRMEKEDQLLPVFYSHLIETLINREASCLSESARSLASIGKISEEYTLLNAVICQDAWAQYSGSKSSVYLVLDDFHNVVGNPAIIESVKYFITNMPPNVHMIIMSRVDTGIPAGKLALGGDMVQIDEQDLRFSKEEIESLAADIYKINVAPGEIDNMLKYTEGWIAGITMLSHTAASGLSDMEKRLAANYDNKHQVFKYFLSEALNGSDKDMLKTLSRISILEDFTIYDLKVIFDMENASEIIDWLEKSNLYIQKVKTKQISYRFHSLFRSALHSFLHELFTASEINKLKLNAANHYKETGDFGKAIRNLIAAGRTEEAVSIASIEGVKFMDNGDVDKVASIVQEFPEELIQSNRYLLFLYGGYLMRVECDQSYSYLRKAFFFFRQSGDLDLLIKTVGLMIAIAFQKSDFKNIKELISHIPKFKTMAVSKHARVTLLMSGFMSTAWTDKLALGDLLYRFIERQGSFEPLWDYTCRMAKCVLLYRKGDLEAAAEKLNQLLYHPTALVNDHWRTIGLVIGHVITSLRGDLEGSQKLAEELAAIGEKYSSDYSTGYALRLAAYIKYQTRDIKGAVSQTEESAIVFARYGNMVMAGAARINKYLWEAEYMPPEALAAKALEELEKLAVLKPGQGSLELCQTCTGILLKDAGNYDAAEKLLMEAYRVSRKKKARHSMCGAAMNLANLYFLKKAAGLEEKFLMIFGKNTAEEGYVYFREMNYATLISVCARCMEKNIYPEHMQKMVSKYFGTDAAEYMAKNPEPAVADPKAFISAFSAAPQKSKCIRVKLFGSFKVLVDEVEIGENEWKTRKISGILKYILANPQKAITRERLAAIFWPESDTKAAYTSLRAALYELRKTLARFKLAFESEDALIIEGKDGFHLNSTHMIETDVDHFSQLYKQYKSKSSSSNNIKELLIRLTQLYDGDFLENDPYDEWAALYCDHYKSMFVEASHHLAGLYISDGEAEAAENLLLRHMKVDPFDEKACSMLIHLYEGTGQKSRAASLRQQFCRRFEAEMGVRPELE